MLTEGKTRGGMSPKNVSEPSIKPLTPPAPVPKCNCDRDSNGTLQCPVHSKKPVMSERERQWIEFSERVLKHLREYTVPQYGDVGEDEITNYTVKDCVKQVEKYAKRYGSQSREGQQELDFIKIAHYAQCSWDKFIHKKEHFDEEYEIVVYDNILTNHDIRVFEYIGMFVEGEKQKYVYKRNIKL